MSTRFYQQKWDVQCYSGDESITSDHETHARQKSVEKDHAPKGKRSITKSEMDKRQKEKQKETQEHRPHASSVRGESFSLSLASGPKRCYEPPDLHVVDHMENTAIVEDMLTKVAKKHKIANFKRI